MHHTADASMGDQFQKVNLYHKNRFAFQSQLNYFVGYHYLIERSGLVLQARLENEEGAHTRGQNKLSIGIALSGNFDFQTPTALQKIALVKLIDRLCKVWQIKPTAIYPHRTFSPTSCYGLTLADNWAREEYKKYVLATIEHQLIIIKAILEKLLQYVKLKN